MEDTSGYFPSVVPPTFTDPISSAFNGIIAIVVIFLIIVLVIIILIAQLFGGMGGGQPAPPVKKETFNDRPPYPHCQTDLFAQV